MRNIDLAAMLAANPQMLSANPGLAQIVREGKVRQSVARHFHRRKVSLSGNARLVDSTVDKQAGVTSLNKGVLDGNQAFLITAIGLRYAFHATDANVYGKRYTNNIYDILDVTADATDIDAGAAGIQSGAVAAQIVHQNLLDSNFKFSVDGKEMLVLPTNDFFIENTVNDKVRSSEDYFVSLDKSPILLLPNKSIDGELEFNPNLAAPANNHFIELILDGVFVF